jgi:hypothetical protein
MYRLLLIETPSKKYDKYIETKKLYLDNIKEFHKRFVKFKGVIGDNFLISLIGFDNKIKAQYTKMNIERIFNKIDKMPMGNLQNKINFSLYVDYHPKKSDKTLGFKNKEKAIYTINKIKNKPIDYQKRVIFTMLNRAKYHPNKTKDMDDAIKIFQKWINKNNK